MSVSAELKVFQQKLASLKKIIDSDIETYTKNFQAETLRKYGEASAVALEAYLGILNRGGKRIRGALVMVGYEMSRSTSSGQAGGTDQKMILQAARAIEMLHAYVLVVDDIADHSTTRRGGPTAHTILSDYHNQQSLIGDHSHYGESVATAAALVGAHAAMTELADLKVDAELRAKAMYMVNQTLMTTGHGQINDIYNEVSPSVNETAVNQVMEWKTAHYTLLGPLQLGMILAGASENELSTIKDYAMAAGQAFQITDDILGVFGDEKITGKNPQDDIREGKRTILTVYALQHAETDDQQFLSHMLGNSYITPEEFKRCQEILHKCGALGHAQTEAAKHAQAALKALAKPMGWDDSGAKFLRGLIHYLQVRTS